jgi:1-acyl-sn-glycerol-3-phosphate acyltransferase
MTHTQTNFVENSWGSRVAYTIFRELAVWLTRAITRLRISGLENLPKEGAYVIAPVHRSYVDTPIVACITRRRIRFMGKEEVWKFAPLGWFISSLGAFPVSRGAADREALRRCVTVLENGEPLVLFPEGERKDGPLIQPLFAGAVFIAARAGVPIVPIGIGGSSRVMPRHAKMIHPQKVHVVIGEPIYPEADESGRVSRREIKDTTAELSSELQRLFDLAQSRVG